MYGGNVGVYEWGGIILCKRWGWGLGVCRVLKTMGTSLQKICFIKLVAYMCWVCGAGRDVCVGVGVCVIVYQEKCLQHPQIEPVLETKMHFTNWYVLIIL